jgi:hypothetical protein
MKMDLDQILVAASDDSLQERYELSIIDIEPRMLVRKFRANKISAERLERVSAELKTEDKKIILEQINSDRTFRDEWFRLLEYVSQALKENDVNYVLIKFLVYSHAMMTDFDLLTLNPQEELKAINLLSEKGFAFFQFRLLAHPLKILARKQENESKADIDLDFYPAPMWIRKKVADNSLIFSRRKSISIKGTEIYVPSPEDDLYLVGTHAFAHLSFTLAEILHGVKTITDHPRFDWDYLYNLARNYGCLDSIYLYLRILNTYCSKYYDDSVVDASIFFLYERFRVCKKIKSWLEQTCSDCIRFPIRVPLRIGSFNSSFYHCKTLYGHVSFSALVNDFLTHYLSLSSRVVLGKS